MPTVTERVRLEPERLAALQAALRERELDGWLWYNFRDTNPIAAAMLGLPPRLTRRYFVLVPVDGPPRALIHRIETGPWAEWPGECRVYLTWQELHAGLRAILGGCRRVALEYSPQDAIPYLDRVPAGVVDLVRSCGVEAVSSGALLARFYARWSAEGRASHRRAATVLADVAQLAFVHAFTHPDETDWGLRGWVLERLQERGVTEGADCIVAVGSDAADPHFAPTPERARPIGRDSVVLLDLWGKEPGSESIYADQTWMAFTGPALPPEVARVWSAVRRARDAVVEHLRRTPLPIPACDLDDVAREVLRQAGLAEAFVHRTGHSIDRDLHGSGPHLDNLETHDTRPLEPGLGFSVEPGVYLPGRFGVRSEINVFLGPDGPEVTPATPQTEPARPGT